MLKLMKYLKSEIRPILIVIILLFLQAFCDLSLPSYTSDIVNVGVQQGGVEYAVPEVIRESKMNGLLLYMTEDEKNTVIEHYTLQTTPAKYTTTENVYQLETEDKEVIQQLEEIFQYPMMIQMMETSQTDQTESIGGSKTPTNQMGIGNSSNASMDPVQMLTIMKEKLSAYPQTMRIQSSIQYVKQEYTDIGVDMQSLQTRYILKVGLKMIGLAFLAMAVAIGVSYLAARVGARVSRNVRSDVFKKVVSFSHREYDKFSTASLITRSTNDVQQVQIFITMVLRTLIYAPILAIGGIIKVVNTNTKMTWILAVSVATLFVIVGGLMIIAMPKFRMVQKLLDRLNLVSRETITGIPVIRAFGTQKYEEERFNKANVDLTRTNLFVNRTMTFMMPMMMLVMNLTTVLIVWFGAKYIDLGTMQVGDMMAFIQYAMQIIMSFLMLTMLSIILPRASVSINRIKEILIVKSTVLDPTETKSSYVSNKGYVEFKDVCFCYPEAEEEVLSHITFTAKPGETTAIVGSTGCGKTTLVNLIPRFYDVTKGEILVDGVNIQDMSMHELRDKLGFVPQKGVLFSGTIESNIKFSDEEMSEEVMKKAARIAQAQDFIEEKPERYNSAIAQGGTNVSGGQKQRLSIARAIAKNPEIYIFDDSFSALDYKTDIALRKALKEETADSTVIIVAQRISTILHAEQIIVLDEGHIVGIGNHKTLMKSCEVYQQIASSQLSKEELDNE